MKEKSQGCGECIHIVKIHGNCHIGCENKNAKPTLKTWPGCGVWPVIYDPVIVQSCDGYEEET